MNAHYTWHHGRMQAIFVFLLCLPWVGLGLVVLLIFFAFFVFFIVIAIIVAIGNDGFGNGDGTFGDAFGGFVGDLDRHGNDFVYAAL